MTISITSPASSASVSGTVAVSGIASALTVTVKDGATTLGSQALSAEPYSINVNTTGLANGAQTLTVTDGVSTATVAVIVSNTSSASPNGTTLNSTTGSIIDNSANSWTLVNLGGSNGLGVDVNGASAGFTQLVTLLLWYNGNIYQENQPGNWYESTGLTSWTAVSGDPRPAAPTLTVTSPASGATVTSPFAVAGATNQSSVKVKNGSTVLVTDTPVSGTYTGNVTLAAGSYTLTVSAGSATSITLPLTVQAASGSGVHYYGVNGHYTQGGVYGSNIAQQVADMQNMGIKVIRQDCYSTANTGTMESLIASFAPVVIQPIWIDPQGNTTAESTAYTNSYNYGVTVANQLAGKVPVIEMFNEPENFFFTPANGPANNGQNVSDWSAYNSQWPTLRGMIRGFYAGFRSVDTTMQTLIASPSVGWLHYGILDGLWNGTAPDGTSGHPTATWDLTNYHWYYDMGNIESAGGVNILSYIKNAYGKPIVLTEVGVQTSVSQTTYDNWISTGNGYALYQSAAATYNILEAIWYQLYTDSTSPDMGLYSSPGTQDANRASTMKSFIAAHPMS